MISQAGDGISLHSEESPIDDKAMGIDEQGAEKRGPGKVDILRFSL